MHKYKTVLHIVGRVYKAQIARPKSLALKWEVKYCVQSIFLTWTGCVLGSAKSAKPIISIWCWSHSAKKSLGDMGKSLSFIAYKLKE